MANPFQASNPNIVGNAAIRTPQREAFEAIFKHNADAGREREVGIVLPVGCGKSGCIALAPFAVKAKRALVVAPGLKIAEQLGKDFDPTKPNYFYLKRGVL